MKLAVKQPLIMLLTFAVIGAISGSALIYFQVKSNADHYMKMGDDLVSILVSNVEQDMLHSSPQAMAQSIDNLSGLAGITKITLYDTGGMVVASNQGKELKQKTDRPDILEAIRGQHIKRSTINDSNGREFDTVRPLFNKPECQRCHGTGQAVLGALEIGIDAEPYFHAIKQQVFLVLITGILTISALGGIFMIASRRLILNRLRLLERGSSRIASGDYSARVNDVSRDEIGSVSVAFNDMAEKVQKSIAQLDETVRIRTEERSTLESIMSGMGEGLVVVDNQGNLVYLNVAAENLLGLKADEFLGQPIDTFSHAMSTRVVEPKDWENVLIATLKQIGDQTKLHFVLQFPERHEIEANFFAVGKPDRRSGTGTVLRDITKEQEVDRMKTEFISVASHELRTPMTVVYGFSELLLKSKSLSQQDLDWVGRIHKESQRLTNIVDDLLNISRIESGRFLLKLEAVSIQPIVMQLIDQFNSAHNSHTFKMSIPDNFPKLWADAERLTQVLYNLLDNAAKYSPRGGPVIVSARMAEEGNQAIIAVSDKGLGIPPEEMPKLFTRFHRIHRPEHASIRGTGLGLSIVKSLVEIMGGRVWVESQVNQGSTFYIALPLGVPE